MNALILLLTSKILSPLTLHLVRYSYQHFIVDEMDSFNVAVNGVAATIPMEEQYGGFEIVELECIWINDSIRDTRCMAEPDGAVLLGSNGDAAARRNV